MRSISSSPISRGRLLGAVGLLLSACIPSSDLRGQEKNGAVKQQDRVDLVGEPLPNGAIARLGTLRYRVRGFNPEGPSIAFIPGQQLLAAQGPNRGVGIWDPATGKVVRGFLS